MEVGLWWRRRAKTWSQGREAALQRMETAFCARVDATTRSFCLLRDEIEATQKDEQRLSPGLWDWDEGAETLASQRS